MVTTPNPTKQLHLSPSFPKLLAVQLVCRVVQEAGITPINISTDMTTVHKVLTSLY